MVPYQPTTQEKRRFHLQDTRIFTAPPKTLARLLGLQNHFAPALHHSQLMCWPLYPLLRCIDWREGNIILSPICRLYLSQLHRYNHLQQHKSYIKHTPTITLDVDASHIASGGVLYTYTATDTHTHTTTGNSHNNTTSTTWNSSQPYSPSKHSHTTWQNTRVHIRMDSTTAIAYINRAGGRIPELQQLAATLLSHCISHNIHITISYINTAIMTADPLSRYMDPEDYRLNTHHFHHLLTWLHSQHLPLPQIDAMASSMNAQLPAFCSRFHHHLNTHTNFYSVNWSQYQAIYINPPFSQCTATIHHLSHSPPAHTYFLAPPSTTTKPQTGTSGS